MARMISLICVLSLCVAAAFAAPVDLTRPAPVAAHHAMGHEAMPATHTAHDPGNLACGICIFHCMPGKIAVAPQTARLAAFRFGTYPAPGHRIPGTVGSDAPERPPKSGLI
ncbi:MAG: hypothetical protein LCH69_00570 [Proteobacteria bacterium]|nr:hypothetical protein [Pseudomonadota bacterium]